MTELLVAMCCSYISDFFLISSEPEEKCQLLISKSLIIQNVNKSIIKYITIIILKKIIKYETFDNFFDKSSQK